MFCVYTIYHMIHEMLVIHSS